MLFILLTLNYTLEECNVFKTKFFTDQLAAEKAADKRFKECSKTGTETEDIYVYAVKDLSKFNTSIETEMYGAPSLLIKGGERIFYETVVAD